MPVSMILMDITEINFIKMKEKVIILNVGLNSVTQQEFLEQLVSGVVVTTNVDQIIKLQSDKEYYNIVRQVEWVIRDSRILLLCSRLMKNPLKEAVSCFQYVSQG